ncbi:UNVERIFIED_CONTAM: mediator complex subunit MED14 [Hammondia hammondi]|eukprot:XP_008889523.1 mediator complex subunit MED14 [Hammondia hammondi]
MQQFQNSPAGETPPSLPLHSLSAPSLPSSLPPSQLSPLYPETEMLSSFFETRPQPLQPLLLLALQRCARDFRSCARVAHAQLSLFASRGRERRPDEEPATAAREEENRRAASTMIRTALIQYCRHTREILLKLFLLDVGWSRQPHHGIVEKLLQEIAAMDQQKHRISQDAFMSQWQLQQQLPPLLPPAPLIDAAVDLLATGMYRRLPLLLPLQLTGKASDPKGEENEDAMDEVRRRVADALLLRLHFSKIPKREVHVHLEKDAHVHISLPHEVQVKAVSDLTTLQPLAVRLSILEENGFGADAAAAASRGAGTPADSAPLGDNAAFLFLLRSHLSAVAERLQLLESEAELDRWQIQVRENAERQLEVLEAEENLLRTVAEDRCPDAHADTSSPSSSSRIGASVSEEVHEEISAFLSSVASGPVLPSPASVPAACDAFFSLWVSSRRVSSCVEMDLLRDQALRLLRVSSAATLAASRVACTSPKPPRRLLLSHVTFRALKQSPHRSLASRLLPALADEDLPHTGGEAGRGPVGLGGDELSGEKETQWEKELGFRGETKTLQCRIVEEEELEEDEDLRVWEEREREGGEEERFFVPLATAAAIAADAEGEFNTDAGDAEGDGGTEDEKKKGAVLLQLKILAGFDITCGGLRSRCLQSLLQKAPDVESSSSGTDLEAREIREGDVKEGGEKSEASDSKGGEKSEGAEVTDAVQVASAAGSGPSKRQLVGPAVEEDRVALPVSLAFILCASSWRVSVSLWPLHAMMELFERPSSSSPACGFLSAADAFALSVISRQDCWRALSSWQPLRLHLEDWISCASQCLGLLQLLTLAYHLRFPLSSASSAAPSVEVASLREASRESEAAHLRSAPPTREADEASFRQEVPEELCTALCRAAAPDSLELLLDGEALPLFSLRAEKEASAPASLPPLTSVSPSPSSVASPTPHAVSWGSPSTCLLRLVYHSRACELSIDPTTGAGQLRCAWLPRRLRDLLEPVPRSLRDLLLLLPLVRRAAFLLLLGEAAVSLGRERFDLLPATPDLASWSPRTAVVAEVHARLRERERRADEALKETRGARRDGGESADAGTRRHRERDESEQGQGDEEVDCGRRDSWTGVCAGKESAVAQPLGGVLASEAAEALQKLLHLRVHETAAFQTTSRSERVGRKRFGGAKCKKRSRDAATPRGESGEGACSVGERVEGGREHEDEERTAEEEDETPQRQGAASVSPSPSTTWTSTAFLRIRVGDEERGPSSTPASTSVSGSSFLVACVLFDDAVVGCTYLLFPAAQPVCGSAASAFADSLGHVFGDQNSGNHASLRSKQREPFAAVRLLHSPFRLSLEQGDATRGRGDSERSLRCISVKTYLRAVHALLRRHVGILRRLEELSSLLPLALPCTAEADVFPTFSTEKESCEFADNCGFAGASDLAPAAVSVSEDVSPGRSASCAGGDEGDNASRGTERRDERRARRDFETQHVSSDESERRLLRCFLLERLLVCDLFDAPPVASRETLSESACVRHNDQKGEERKTETGEKEEESNLEEEALLLACSVNQDDASDALSGQPSGRRSLLSFLFSPPLSERSHATTACESERSSSFSPLRRPGAPFSFFLLLSASRLAFVCKPANAQASEVILPLSDFLNSLQSDARKASVSSAVSRVSASLWAKATAKEPATTEQDARGTDGGRDSKGTKAEAARQERQDRDDRDYREKREGREGRREEGDFFLPVVKLFWRVREGDAAGGEVSVAEGEKETVVAETPGGKAPDKPERGSLSESKEVHIECTCQIREVKPAADRGSCLERSLRVEKREISDVEKPAGGEGEARDSRHELSQDDSEPCDPQSDAQANPTLVATQCRDLRVVCALPYGEDLLTGTQVSSVGASRQSAAFAGTVGRCLAAFLRLEVYIHLHRDLLFLQRQAYGNSIEILACFPGALHFLLHTPARRRTVGDRQEVPFSSKLSSPFSARDAQAPTASSLRAESPNACETLTCTVALASLFPPPPTSSACSEPPNALPLIHSARHSRTRSLSCSTTALVSAPHLVSLTSTSSSSSSSSPPSSSLSSSSASSLAPSVSPSSLWGASVGSSVVAFRVTASSSLLSWLFARQAEAAQRLLPQHLGTMLQLLSSSSEVLASYLALHDCLLLTTPVKRRALRSPQYRQAQQRRVRAFRGTPLFLALSQSENGEKSRGNELVQAAREAKAECAPDAGSAPSCGVQAAAARGQGDSGELSRDERREKAHAELNAAFSETCETPEKTLRALSDAAAAAGLELTQVYVQSVSPAPRAQATSRGGGGEASGFSGTSQRSVSALSLSLPSPLSGEEGGAFAEDSTLASACLPALLLRVPGLPPVLLRLDHACRCCLRLYVVLQETREPPPQRGVPGKNPGESAAFIRSGNTRSDGPQRTHAEHAEQGRGAKTVQYVDVEGAAGAAHLASLFEAAEREKRGEEGELLSRLRQSVSFQVLLLASFASALKHFASAACAAIRVDHFETAQGKAEHASFKVKRERGDGDADEMAEQNAQTSERLHAAPPACGSRLAPAVSPFFLLGAASQSSSRVSSSLLSELPRLFLSPSTCLKLACASPLLLGGSHCLYTTAPVASLFFFPGLLLPQVLLPLLQLCRVFAVYSTAKVSLSASAILSASSLSPSLSPSSPVVLESVVLKASDPETDAATPLPETHVAGDEAKDERDPALTLSVSYSDFSSSPCRVLCAAVPASPSSTAFNTREGEKAACRSGVKPASERSETPLVSRFLLSHDSLFEAKETPWKFVRPRLFNLPWPAGADGGTELAGKMSSQEEQTSYGFAQREKGGEEIRGQSTSLTDIAWSSATSQALLAPWGFAVSPRPNIRRQTENEIPPLLPRLHADSDGCMRVVLPFFHLQLGSASAAGAKNRENTRSLSVLQTFMCSVAPCLPLNNIPTFVTHFLHAHAVRERQTKASASAPASRNSLRETATWLLQPLRSLAAHLAFHAALVSLRKERARAKDEKGERLKGERPTEEYRNEEKQSDATGEASLPPLPRVPSGEEESITCRVAYVTGCPDSGTRRREGHDVKAAAQEERDSTHAGDHAFSTLTKSESGSLPDSGEGLGARRSAEADARIREEWFYRCYYPSLSETSLDADPAFVRFCCLVESLHDGLLHSFSLYKDEYCRMRSFLARVFAYLDARQWRLDLRRDSELRALVAGETKTQLAVSAECGVERTSPSSSLSCSVRDAAPRDRSGDTSHGGTHSRAEIAGFKETKGVDSQTGAQTRLPEIETPSAGIPLLIPLPKLPFIECRFLPQQTPDSLCMEFALHRLLPLQHCPFYSLLHFLHLLPPRVELPFLLPPAPVPSTTQPVLLLQPRLKVAPPSSSSAGVQQGGVSEGRGGEERSQEPSVSKEEAPSRLALGACSESQAAQGTASLAQQLSPFVVYRCFTATLRIHPFPPPHVSFIHIQGVKLPALLQELQRHERRVSTAVLKPQMERVSRNFHLPISYSLAACASLFFGAVDFDGLARALQKLASQHETGELPEGAKAGTTGQAQVHAPPPSSRSGVSGGPQPARPPVAAAPCELQADAPSSSAVAPSSHAEAVAKVPQKATLSAPDARVSAQAQQPSGRVDSFAINRPGAAAAAAVPSPLQKRETWADSAAGRNPVTSDASTPTNTFVETQIQRTASANTAASRGIYQESHPASRLSPGHGEGGGPGVRTPQTVEPRASSVAPAGAERHFPGHAHLQAQGLRSADVDPAQQRGTQGRHFGNAFVVGGTEAGIRSLPGKEASVPQIKGGPQELSRCVSSQQGERDFSPGLGHPGVQIASAAGIPGVQCMQTAGLGSTLHAVPGSPHLVPTQRQGPLRPSVEGSQAAFDARVNGQIPGDSGSAAHSGRRAAACAVSTDQEAGRTASHRTLPGMRAPAQVLVEPPRHPGYVEDPQGGYRRGEGISQPHAASGGTQAAMAHAAMHVSGAPPQQIPMAANGMSGLPMGHGQELSLQARQVSPASQAQPQEAYGGNVGQPHTEGYASFGGERQMGRLAGYSGGSEGGREQVSRGARTQQEAFHGAHGFAHSSRPHQASSPHFHLIQHQGSQQVGRSLSGQLPQHTAAQGARPGFVVAQTPAGVTSTQMRHGDTQEALMLQARQGRMQQTPHQHAIHAQQQVSYDVAQRGTAGTEVVGGPAASTGVAGIHHVQRGGTVWRSGGGEVLHQGAQQMQSPPRQTYAAHASNPEESQQNTRSGGPDPSSYGVYGGQGYQVGGRDAGGTSQYLHQAGTTASLTPTHRQQPIPGVHTQPRMHMQHAPQLDRGISRQVAHPGVSESGAPGCGVPHAQMQQTQVSVHPAASRNSHPVCSGQRELYQQVNADTGAGGYGYSMQPQQSSQPGHTPHDPHQQMHPSGGGGPGW